ncbi:nucleotidyltransferase family protein [Rhizobium sp. CF142]|uniref:nucleotidyltransferase family protein n=1 Tax=Rhizobium sp. CF142 TaxID=1144314 RepID=UPI00026F04EB|nr:nucleotidyltransferase family protein [Rhizobium sp. CF142]EJJ26170.1 putative MobA-like protein [Rhizobium sp. CF142]
MNAERGASVAIVVLAAGRSSRMGEGGPHKLLATFDGIPLVRRSVTNALGCDCTGVFVVAGHRHEEVTAPIHDLPCRIIRNEGYESGMAGSLRLGVAAAARTAPDGIMITLADMPDLLTEHLDVLVAAFRGSGANSIVRAVGHGTQGNPVIFPRILHGDLQELKGDIGARSLVKSSGIQVVDVEIGATALLDVDTVEQVLAAGGTLPGSGKKETK